jgi:hypothetical protein
MASTPLGGRPLAKKDGVTMYMLDRLGNQLFVYAAGLAQARRLGVPCYVNLAFYRHRRPRRPYRKSYELGLFDSNVIIPEGEQYHRRLYRAMPTVAAAGIWHNQVAPRLSFAGSPVFMEGSYRYDARIQTIQPGTTILGTFQSWRYFVDSADEIRDRVSTILQPSAWYISMARQITPGSGAIALNVRRGDYREPKQLRHQGLTERGYYERSLRHLRRLGLDGPVFVASDSLEDVLVEFQGMRDLVPLSAPPGVHPIEVLILLSRVDGLVAGNSTFSWWAGFLGDRPDRVVVAPRPWFTANTDTRDLLPPSWLTIDRGGGEDYGGSGNDDGETAT